MAVEDRGRYYDIISDPGKRLAHEGEFLKWLLGRAPGKRVLDMAAGTGVQAEFLARQGATVTARDIDPDMIAYAGRTRRHERVRYEIGDMRDAAGGPFDLVIIMGNSLSLLPSRDDAAAAMSRMAEALAPGGAGFVHVVNYAKLATEGAKQKISRRAASGGEIVIIKDMASAEGAGALVSFAYFERTGGAWRTWGSQSALLDLGRESLRGAAEGAGLAVEAEYGDYDRSAFDEKASPDVLMVVRKSGG